MSNPAVSVIIPTYKHRDYVLRTVESVLAQTFADFEIIVVNDGSPDDTAQVLQPLVESGKITYVDQSNSGHAAARNRGFAGARGKLLAFLDDDDLWPLDNLESQMRVLQDAPPEVVACVGQCQYVSEVKLPQPTPVVDETITFERLLCRNSIISPGQVLIRKSALEAVGGFGAVRGGADDWDCWLRLAKHGKILANEHVSLLHTVHPSGGSASHNAISMLSSANEVIAAHTRDVPLATRRDAFCSLLDQASIFVVTQMTRALGRGNLNEFSQGCKWLLNTLNKADWRMAGVKAVARAFFDTFKALARSRLRRKTI